MSNDLEKIAAVEAAAAARLKEIRKKRKTIERAELEAKKLAIGDGIQRAIKAGDLSWADIKPALKKHVRNKKYREILLLENE